MVARQPPHKADLLGGEGAPVEYYQIPLAQEIVVTGLILYYLIIIIVRDIYALVDSEQQTHRQVEEIQEQDQRKRLLVSAAVAR